MTFDIEISNVSKRFGEVIAVDNLNLQVNIGEIFCLVGPNAAGKTTTIRLLLGILKSEKGSGDILVKGYHIPQEKKKLRRIMGYLPQQRALYDLLTAKENIKFFARAKGVPGKHVDEYASVMINKLSLTDHQDKLALHLSGGTQQRTALAQAMVNKPEIAFLDEPTVGLDPVLRREFWQYFREIAKDQGTTILVTTHYLNEAEWADRVGVMRDGSLLAVDTPENLLKRTGQINMENMFFELIKEDTA
ncbi:MAG: ABC transporter ATP-binding protein [Candidatus Heimdallarchaeota archaeon]|nr:MAG: ABC transporter ATP-binding protein [Candidatus Heimdallarchaeota archaeon]